MTICRAEPLETRRLLAAALLKDINTASVSSGPRELTAVGNTLYFIASSPDVGTELWKPDGTAGGTTMVADLVSGRFGSDPR